MWTRCMRSSLPKTKTACDRNIYFLKSVEERLKRSRVPAASSEAEQLVRHFSGIDRLDFFTGKKAVTSRAKRSVESALRLRLKGKPLSYVLKEAEFFGFKFFVSADTLIPRPETEVLAEEALRVLEKRITPEILDIGTGTGCLAVSLTIQRTDCRMTALDVSSKALKIARKNINFHGLSQKVNLVKSDLFSHFGPEKKNFWDLIVTNPPYVASEDFPGLSKEVFSEPRLALDGGPKGFSVIDAILEKAPYYLKVGGRLLMEIGDGQAPALKKKILKDKRFSNLYFAKDLNGIDRVLAVQKS